MGVVVLLGVVAAITNEEIVKQIREWDAVVHSLFLGSLHEVVYGSRSQIP